MREVHLAQLPVAGDTQIHPHRAVFVPSETGELGAIGEEELSLISPFGRVPVGKPLHPLPSGLDDATQI